MYGGYLSIAIIRVYSYVQVHINIYCTYMHLLEFESYNKQAVCIPYLTYTCTYRIGTGSFVCVCALAFIAIIAYAHCAFFYFLIVLRYDE